MTWIKLDDEIFNSSPFIGASKEAKLLHIAGICHSGRTTTDGAIHRNAVAILGAQTGVSNIKKPITELVDSGLWTVADDGYQIVDFLVLNTSAEEVRSKREASRKRMQGVRSPSVRANKT